MKKEIKKIVRSWERARDNVIALTNRADFNLSSHATLLNFLISKRDKLEIEMNHYARILDVNTSDELKKWNGR